MVRAYYTIVDTNLASQVPEQQANRKLANDPVFEWLSNLPVLRYNFLPAVEAQFLRSVSLISAKKGAMQPSRGIRRALLLLAGATAFLIVIPARGHAILLESTPSLKSVVSGPDVPVKLRFNVRIDALRSRLTLIRSDGSSQALELSKQTPADTLAASANGLSAGDYRLRWQVLASDGHITRGEIPFSVAPS